MTEEAIRHPKRGKAHRPVPLRTTVWSAQQYRNGKYEAAACRPRTLSDWDGLTERIALNRIDPADWCKRCWPTKEDA